MRQVPVRPLCMRYQVYTTAVLQAEYYRAEMNGSQDAQYCAVWSRVEYPTCLTIFEMRNNDNALFCGGPFESLVCMVGNAQRVLLRINVRVLVCRVLTVMHS